MIDFEEFKSKVSTSIEKAAYSTKDFADLAADKARDVARVAKLSIEINGEKDVIRKAYAEIGKLYYETYKDNPDGFFIQLCDEVTLARENISAKEAEISNIKSSTNFDDDSIVVEFEEIPAEEPEEAEEAEEADSVSLEDLECEVEAADEGCCCGEHDDDCSCGGDCGCGDDCTCGGDASEENKD